MKLETGSSFKPITITLETKEEAEAVWDAVAKLSSKEKGVKKSALVALDVMFCELRNSGRVELDRR